ncbi:hypothetical protein [Bradyrhizobium sp. Bra64]|uniref:hypothetical protein n=1 Tax=Bradyrhizobium sp. Bra64 TaxID=2926009 RepID=UPI0021195E09|nr:hypothetical protein [Bradyrhizobium sp. Bra64]
MASDKAPSFGGVPFGLGKVLLDRGQVHRLTTPVGWKRFGGAAQSFSVAMLMMPGPSGIAES